jgi:hypothetical protein
MNRFFLAFCCAFFACALSARHIPTPFDPVNGSPYAKYKNEFAWDLKGFLYAAPTASVTYRMQLNGERRKNSYCNNVLRLHANGYSGFPFNEVTDIDAEPMHVAATYFASGPIAQRYTAGNLFAGIERQRFIKRLVFYHGAEIGGGYSRFTSKYFSANNPENVNEQHLSEAKIYLSCFAGLKFFVVPQVSLSVECNALGGINFRHQKLDYYEYDAAGINAVQTTVTLDAQNYFLKSNRLRTLNIAFHF